MARLKPMLRAIAWLALLAGSPVPAQPGTPAEPLLPDEIAIIASLGPWPQAPHRDPSNALSGTRAGIALGRALFSDQRLSGDSSRSCLHCHRPGLGFSDGLELSMGKAPLTRNSPTLWNLAGQRWFAWDGASDSLWMHSLKPILNPLEMASSARQVADLLRNDPKLAALVSKLPEHNLRMAPSVSADQGLAVSAAKALAAFTETLRSPRTAFDNYRDAVVAANWSEAQRYPKDAQRGLMLFIGKGNCIACHAGPGFTNGEFADTGVGHFIRTPGANGAVDSGRHGGALKVLSDPYNLLGQFSDTAPDETTATRYLKTHHALFGQFKVPGLRELVRSGPYMHDGRLASLRDVVKHYSSINPDRLHSDGEKSLRALNLGEQEIDDLVAFLRSLSASPARAKN